MSEKVTMRYSEAFKLQVVSEIEGGRFGGPYEASQAYGIRGHCTVREWVKKYGRRETLRRVVRVEKAGEPGEIKRLRERVRKLEAALADAHMDGALDRAFFEILCERTGTDPEAFKKKHGGKGSIEREEGLGGGGE